MKIIIKNEKTLSWNSVYSQNSWYNRKLLADGVHERVRAALIDNGYPPFTKKNLFKNKVKIILTAFFNTNDRRIRLIDPDNVAAKFYIDGLKYILLHDDTPEFVEEVTTRSKKGEANYLEIEIIETMSNNQDIQKGGE